MEINLIDAPKILNPASINLGEYVINPYRGCPYACLYCYVRHNKAARKDGRPWGSYLDVRMNAAEVLEKELDEKRPKKVLLGSTTECFCLQEKEFGVTSRVLDVLNRRGVRYSILTRSPVIKDYKPLLKKELCESIYFTVNDFEGPLKAALEKASPDLQARIEAASDLLADGFPVIPYYSPVLPLISKFGAIFALLPKAERADFEGLNFDLGNIDEVIKAVGELYPEAGALHKKMAWDRKAYEDAWYSVKREIAGAAAAHKKGYRVYIHGFRAYFKNKY